MAMNGLSGAWTVAQRKRATLRTISVAVLIFIAASAGTSLAAEPAPASSFEVMDYVREVAKHGTLGILLLAVLWQYRRDFFARILEKDGALASIRAERDDLKAVLALNTKAITDAAIAMARQTDATHRLARTVEHLDRKFDGN
jgi:hypothetical protein